MIISAVMHGALTRHAGMPAAVPVALSHNAQDTRSQELSDWDLLKCTLQVHVGDAQQHHAHQVALEASTLHGTVLICSCHVFPCNARQAIADRLESSCYWSMSLCVAKLRPLCVFTGDGCASRSEAIRHCNQVLLYLTPLFPYCQECRLLLQKLLQQL